MKMRKLINNWYCQKILPTWKEKHQKWKNPHKKTQKKIKPFFGGDSRCEQLVQLLCQGTYKKYFRECKHKLICTTALGLLLHCVTLKGETHTQETNVISVMVFPACRAEKICQVCCILHILPGFCFTMPPYSGCNGIINAVYSDYFKDLILFFPVQFLEWLQV